VTSQKLTSLNKSISSDVEFRVSEFEENKKDLDNNRYYFERLIKAFMERFEEEVTKLEQEFSEIQSNLPAAERLMDSIRKDFLERRSFFIVTAALTNSGNSSTSVKKPALFRVYIGTGNYVDIKLEVEDYKNTAQIPAHGTRIVTLRSREIRSMPDADRGLINTYWQQSVHSILFLEDTFGEVHHSNRIAFAEGLSQKIVYDRLAKEASNESHFVPGK
jgi:hypothetical protein